MERLDQDAYTGPPPRFAPGATVYYQGQPYTVSAVHRGIGDWLYDLDGPAEWVQANEGELHAQADLTQIGQLVARIDPVVLAGAVPAMQQAGTAFQLAAIGLSAMRGFLAGLQPSSAFRAAAQHATTIERHVCTLQALTGLPYEVCQRAAWGYAATIDTLIDGLKAGYIELTAEGVVTAARDRYDPLS